MLLLVRGRNAAAHDFGKEPGGERAYNRDEDERDTGRTPAIEKINLFGSEVLLHTRPTRLNLTPPASLHLCSLIVVVGGDTISSGNMFCYFRVSIAGGAPRTLTLELDDKNCPKTSNNFAKLCSSAATAKRNSPNNEPTYRGTDFHR